MQKIDVLKVETKNDVDEYLFINFLVKNIIIVLFLKNKILLQI